MKNLDSVSTKLIKDKALLRLNMHILAIRYLKKKVFRFTEVTGDNEKIIEDSGKAETIFNSKEEIKKKGFK